jgi:hypothetical protein
MLNNNFFEQPEVDILINKAIKKISNSSLDEKEFLIGSLITFFRLNKGEYSVEENIKNSIEKLENKDLSYFYENNSDKYFDGEGHLKLAWIDDYVEKNVKNSIEKLEEKNYIS